MPNKKKRAYRDPHADRIARGIGWLSVGLGLAQILAPKTVCRLVGLPAAPVLTRLCGFRGLACGIGILTQADPSPWLKARVAGDVMDLACLAGSAPLQESSAGRISAALGAVAGLTALDVYCVRELAGDRPAAPVHIADTITIGRPPDVLYRFWRNLTNLPRVMPYLKSVRTIDDQRSHWTAAGPGGAIEWDSEIIDDRPNQWFAWRSLETSPVYNAGSVRFDPTPDGSGTAVTVELLYEPPAGTIGASLARLLRKGARIRADLAAFQRIIESNDVAAAPRRA
jgi:uncharacterized membrane protein